MNKIKYLLIVLCSALLTISCDDYLDFERPGQTETKDAFKTSNDAVAVLTGAYAPMTTQYYYGTYIYEWWIGDVCADDALKGGDNPDVGSMPDVFDIENFRTRSDNSFAHYFYKAQYVGVFRANFVLENVPTMDPAVFEAGLYDRIIGEAYFLRAFYHHRLVRVYGGVPIVDGIVRVQAEWQTPRNTEQEVYNFIESDLKQAIALLPVANHKLVTGADIGRATKGAARALLMKVYMNQGKFAEAKAQGDSIITIDPYRYDLLADYNQNFDAEFEYNKESLFEIGYDNTSGEDWQAGGRGSMGSFRSNLGSKFCRPPWAQPNPVLFPGTNLDKTLGWAWRRPSPELWAEFEEGDMRRDAAIINPRIITDADYHPLLDDNGNVVLDEQGNSIMVTDVISGFPFEGETVTTVNTYLGIRYYTRKYAEMLPDTTFIPFRNSDNNHGNINIKEIRYSDVLLMHAEACVKTGDIATAKANLEKVRARARAFSGGGNVLPPFPNYSIPMRGVGQDGSKRLQDTPEDLYLAIQHERRVELAMEGHRWFDLKRWGLLPKVMNYYKANVAPHILDAYDIQDFVEGKHELFPIPLEEIHLNPLLKQNPGYDGVPLR